MKNKLYILLAIVIGYKAYSQNVGIGTTAPTKSLHVKTDNTYILRLEDAVNTDDTNWTIVSADNVGTFKKTPTEIFRSTTIITLPSSGATVSTAYPAWQATGIKITIPPGKWNLNGWMALIPSQDITTYGDVGFVGRFTIADTASGVMPSADLIGAYPNSGTGYLLGKVVAPVPKEMASGIIFINNTSTSPKDYYFIANIERNIGTHASLSTVNFMNFGSGNVPENEIYVMPINDN